MKHLTLFITLISLIYISAKAQETVRDHDGNEYNIVQIGTQLWMAADLRVLHFRNGNPIPNIKDPREWNNLTSAAYCYLNNDPVSSNGPLYNWHAAVDQRGICPAGWRVPFDSEWTKLTTFISGEKGIGIVLPESVLLNQKMFPVLPEGLRGYDGEFHVLGYGGGGWWSSTSYTKETAFYRDIYYNTPGNLQMDAPKSYGYNIRCIKD